MGSRMIFRMDDSVERRFNKYVKSLGDTRGLRTYVANAAFKEYLDRIGVREDDDGGEQEGAEQKQ